MANTIVTPLNRAKLPVPPVTGVFVGAFFLAWLALILTLGARGAFVAPAGAPPLALLIGLVAPLTLSSVRRLGTEDSGDSGNSAGQDQAFAYS